MRSGTAGRLPGEALCGHAVRVYDEETELVDGVAAYLAEGFERGERALAIVTGAHADAIRAALRRRRADDRLLTTADAEATLASFLENAGPSPERFHRVIGRLLADVERHDGGSPVRLYGEMVDLLAHRGRHDAALALEELWDALVHRRRLSLLCAYGLDLFDAETQRSVLPGVYRAHGRVEPTLDPARLDRALDEALGAEEAARVRRLAADGGNEHVPAPELALLWVGARMPAAAGRILAAVRAAYERPVPVAAR